MDSLVLSQLSIDKNVPQPAYKQLAEEVLGLINRGDISVGDQLPTVNEFAEITQLSRMTIQRAMQILQQSGCVMAQRGRGAFVVSTESQLKDRPSIGFVVRPDRDPSVDPFYSEILAGVAEESRRNHIDLAFALRESEIEEDITQSGFPLLHKVSSILLAGFMPNSFYDYLYEFQIPCVLIDSLPARWQPYDEVTVDHIRTGWLIGEYLYRLGHRHVLYLNGPQEIRAYQECLQGLCKALPKDDRVSIHEMKGAQSIQSARQRIGEALERGLEFTAVVGCNDTVAIGAMNELQDRGYRVPEEYSVCGVGNIPFAAQARPPLTTVHIAKREMGIRGVQLLLNRMKNPNTLHETVFLEVELIERQSAGPAPTF